MLLNELKKVLSDGLDRPLQVTLHDGADIPEYFHVTEVGQVTKTFIDCGGKTHVATGCVLQIWLGSDVDHRLSTKKLAKILTLSESIIPIEAIPLEVEYERGVISQYPVTGATVTAGVVTLQLGAKHTDCRAKDICIQPVGQEKGCCRP